MPTLTNARTGHSQQATHAQSVAWFVNSLGYGDSLLYWGEILPDYIRSFPNSHFFTTVDGDKPIQGTEKAVHQVPSWLLHLGKRKESYSRKMSFVPPWTLGMVRRTNPELMVISEFTMPSLYGAMVKRRWNSRLLLLVESDPLRGNANRIRGWRRSLRRFVTKRADLVLTNNTAGAEYLENSLAVPQSKIIQRPYVVSSGVSKLPTDESTNLRREFNCEDRVVFLYVGQLVERKGISQLLDAVVQLDETTRSQMCIWIVGDGDQRQELERRVEESGVQDTIRLIGKVPYERVASYYNQADVFVMPTLDDYRALVGFEAIGFGLPILHSIHDGAAGEVVRDGENGWRFDPRDSDGFSERLRWMVNSRDQHNAMGEVSREIAAQFTVDVAVQTLVDATVQCLAT